jgi:hypothetical protein
MSENDERRIAAAVERYVRAMSMAAETDLRAAFHPSASIIGNYGGAVEWLTVDDYVKEVAAAGLPPNENPDWKLLSLDITQDAAVVKVEDEFGGMTFTDYLSLLEIAGKWKIVSKLYHLHT